MIDLKFLKKTKSFWLLIALLVFVGFFIIHFYLIYYRSGVTINIYSFTDAAATEAKDKYGEEYTVKLFEESLQSIDPNAHCQVMYYLMMPSPAGGSSQYDAKCSIASSNYFESRKIKTSLEQSSRLKSLASYKVIISNPYDFSGTIIYLKNLIVHENI